MSDKKLLVGISLLALGVIFLVMINFWAGIIMLSAGAILTLEIKR